MTTCCTHRLRPPCPDLIGRELYAAHRRHRCDVRWCWRWHSLGDAMLNEAVASVAGQPLMADKRWRQGRSLCIRPVTGKARTAGCLPVEDAITQGHHLGRGTRWRRAGSGGDSARADARCNRSATTLWRRRSCSSVVRRGSVGLRARDQQEPKAESENNTDVAATVAH